MRLASVGRMVPIAGRPLPALCFLALWHVSGTYIMWLTIWILSVFQIQSSLCFPISSTRQGIFVVFWTYIAFWDVFLNANLSSDFMSLRCSAALCTSSRIRKLFSAKSKKGLRSQTLCCSYPDQISPPGGQHRFHGCCVSWAMGQHHMPLMSSSSFCVVLKIHGGKNAWQNKQMQRLHLCWKCSNCTKSIDCFQSKNWKKEILRSLDWSCQQHEFHLLRNSSLAYHCHVVHSKGGFALLDVFRRCYMASVCCFSNRNIFEHT